MCQQRSACGRGYSEVYVGQVSPKVRWPPKELKGFARVRLRPGETKRVSVALDVRSFTEYDKNKENWPAEAGESTSKVGRSSEERPLVTTVKLARALSLGNDKIAKHRTGSGIHPRPCCPRLSSSRIRHFRERAREGG